MSTDVRSGISVKNHINVKTQLSSGLQLAQWVGSFLEATKIKEKTQDV